MSESGPRFDMLLTQAIGFGLYVFVLWKVAAKPIAGLLDERRATIGKAFADIDQQRADLAAMRGEYETRLARLTAETETRYQQAEAEGARIAAELRADADQRYRDLIAKAKGDIEREIAKARITFRDAIAVTATATAEDIIRRRMDDQLQHALIDRYIEDLSRVHV